MQVGRRSIFVAIATAVAAIPAVATVIAVATVAAITAAIATITVAAAVAAITTVATIAATTTAATRAAAVATVAAATTTTARAAIAAAATTGGELALDRLINAQGASTEIGAIQAFDGGIAGFTAGQRHKRKAARPASGTIQRQVKIHHRAVGFKKGSDFRLSGGKRQIADKQFHTLILSQVLYGLTQRIRSLGRWWTLTGQSMEMTFGEGDNGPGDLRT